MKQIHLIWKNRKQYSINPSRTSQGKTNDYILLDVFPLDTRETIKNRVSWILQTLPKYLWIDYIEYLPTAMEDKFNEVERSLRLDDDAEQTPESEENTILQTLQVLRETNNSQTILQTLVDMRETFQHEQLLKDYSFGEDTNTAEIKALIAEDIFTIVREEMRQGFTLAQIKNKYSQKFPEEITQEAWEADVREHNNKVQANNLKQHLFLTQMRDFDFLPLDELPAETEFVSDSILYKHLFSFKGSLFSIFDNLSTSVKYPFITYKGFYKIVSDYDSSDIQDSPDYCVLIKQHNALEITIHQISFGRFKIVIQHENQIEAFKDILSQLPPVSSSTSAFKYSIDNLGGFWSYDYQVDVNIMSDIIMNDNILSQYITTQDNMILNKIKNLRIIGFFGDGNGDTGNVSFLVASGWKLDIKISKCPNYETFQLIKYIVDRLLVLYINNSKIIIDSYRRFGVSLEFSKVKKPEKYLKDIDPMVFGGKYVRKCQKFREPTILTQEEASVVVGKQVLLFPSQQDALSEGLEQRYYVCNNPEFKYPGLIVNNDNSQVLGGLQPCCFKENQKNKPRYKKYFGTTATTSNEVGGAERAVDKDYFIKTNKIIIGNSLGEFNNNINKCFDPDKSMFILRYGIDHTKNSFLECILRALKYSLPDESNARVEYINEVRKNLLTLNNQVNIEVMSQENYGYSPSQQREWLVDNNVFLDPRRSIKIMERIFNCNILLFSRTIEEPRGCILKPRCVQGYNHFVRNDTIPSVFIYIHPGVLDKPDFMHCELIAHAPIELETAIRLNPGLLEDLTELEGNNPLVFTNNSVAYKFCWMLWDNIISQYQGFKRIISVDNILPWDIQKQYIDTLGKTRKINIKYNGEEFTIETSPLPPLNISSSDFVVKIASVETAEKFFKEWGNKNSISDSSHGLISVQGNYNNMFDIKVFVSEAPREADVSSEKSVKTIIGDNKKISKYLINYVMWLFSRWLDTASVDIFSVGSTEMWRFVSKNILIDKNFQYVEVGDIFTLRGGMMRNNKLVITDEQILTGLLFQIKLFLHNRTEELLNFRNNELMPNYYQNVADFKQPLVGNILFYTPTVNNQLRLKKIANIKHQHHQLYDGINTSSGGGGGESGVNGAKNPYFSKNFQVNGENIFLTQNISSVEKAIDKLDTWNTYHYNNSVGVAEPKAERSEGRATDADFQLYAMSLDKQRTEKYIVGSFQSEESSKKIMATISGAGKEIFAPVLKL